MQRRTHLVTIGIAALAPLSGCCSDECGGPGSGGGSDDPGGPLLEFTQSPARPAIGDRVSLTVTSNRDVGWNVRLPERWSRSDTSRELRAQGPTPLGSTGAVSPELTVFAVEGELRTPIRIAVQARANEATAQVREVRRSNIGRRTLVFYEITTGERPVRWPDTPGVWQLHFDTEGLGPSDSISVDDADAGWEGPTQAFGPESDPSRFDDGRRDPAEWFRFTSSLAMDAILDGAFTITVNVVSERADTFSVKSTIDLILE